MDGLGEFREHLGGELTVTLLREIGRGFEVHELHEDLVRESMGLAAPTRAPPVRLPAGGGAHLTYCTNIHAGETWPEVRANLERYVLAVKAPVAPGLPFGVGLRLSAAAADALELLPEDEEHVAGRLQVARALRGRRRAHGGADAPAPRHPSPHPGADGNGPRLPPVPGA
jgi:hypothetical protein